MPRLGGDLTNRGRQVPYHKRIPKPNLRNILLALAGFFIMRNLLRNDYVKEETGYLMEQFSPSELDKVVLKTAEERDKFVQSRGRDVDRMKQDITYLMNQLHELKHKASGGVELDRSDAREAGLKEMDELHLKKRREREEQLLRDHPDFKPSVRKGKFAGDGTTTTS
eukprot:Nitzschia sp. Nitz4//scaffold92_size79448//25391//25891//NITZ4_005389-RA/size79448-processed-gene-0.55-mRNA-1//1//CDS//3329560180//3657//frame0